MTVNATNERVKIQMHALATPDNADRLERDLRQAILSGRMKPETRLLPLRDLASQYDISHGRAQRVLNRLRKQGYVVTRQGNGTFVANVREERTVESRHPDSEASIALLVPREVLEDQREFFISTEFLWSFESTVREANATMQVMSFEKLATPELEERVRSRRVLVVIHHPHRSDVELAAVDAWTQQGHQIILLGGPLAYADRVFCLGVDYGWGIQTAVRHLVTLGHKRIALLSHAWPDDKAAFRSWTEEREQAYLEAMRQHNLRPKLTRLSVPGTWVGDLAAFVGASANSKERATAVICIYDQLALTLWDLCRRRGIRVPEDVSIIGFDDMPKALTSGLTTFHHPEADLAAVAAKLALRANAGGPEFHCRGLLRLAPTLIVRQSTRRCTG
jgi:DNA-binding LacI/PurR family transcriptional regulator